MKKGTAFVLGTLLGAVGFGAIIMNNAENGETVFENDDMEVVACSNELENGEKLAYIKPKKQTQEVES